MASNINSAEYWEQRFSSGHWEQRRGRSQTTAFAEKQVQLLRLPTTFSGRLLDFGCGLGDALPVYRIRFPSARLLGMDHSESAIQQCCEKYGHLAQFTKGDLLAVPEVEIIVASNVLEHISLHEAAVATLLSKCSELYVFVPYREHPLCSEHVNCYDDRSFSSFDILERRVFASRGWSQYGLALWVNIYLKNLLRPLFRKPWAYRRKQIMYRIAGRASPVL